jgi:hypothetical protein
MASKCFLKPFVTIPVAPVIAGIIIHFMFPIHSISILSTSASFLLPLPDIPGLWYCHIYQYARCTFLFVIIISCLFAITSLSVCNTSTSSCSHIIIIIFIRRSSVSRNSSVSILTGPRALRSASSSLQGENMHMNMNTCGSSHYGPDARRPYRPFVPPY